MLVMTKYGIKTSALDVMAMSIHGISGKGSLMSDSYIWHVWVSYDDFAGLLSPSMGISIYRLLLATMP